MTWYAKGKVSNTAGSAVITGTGTSFLTDKIRAGDALVLAGDVHEIKAVDSDTQLTLARTLVAANTSSDYSIIPITGAIATGAYMEASLVNAIAEQLRRDQALMLGFQDLLYSTTPLDITVLLPDGSSVTVPNWAKISKNVADVSDLTDAIDSITNNNIVLKGKITSNAPATADGDYMSKKEVLDAIGDVLEIKGQLLADVDLNTLGDAEHVGVWLQEEDANATTALHYPEAKGGVLEVLPTRHGVMQRYSSQSGNVYVRNPSAQWDGSSGPWSGWSRVNLKVSDVTGSAISVSGSDSRKVSDVLLSNEAAINDVRLPENMLLFPCFRSQDNVGVYFQKSIQGWKFENISDEQMKTTSYEGTVGGRDASLIYYRGKWHMAVTWYDRGNFDATIFRSSDLTNWEVIRVNAGTSPIGSTTKPAPGATHACDQIWGPCLFVDNDVLYMGLTLPWGANANDINGNSIPDFRQFLCTCTDADNLKFSAPVLVTQTGNTRCQIDGSFYKIGNTWHMITKNDYDKGIEDWTSSALAGPYTKARNIIAGGTLQSEGPKLVVMNGSGPKYRLYTDGYTDGFYYCTTSNDFVTWTTPQPIDSDTTHRHGDVINVANLPVSAQRDVLAFCAAGSRSRGERQLITGNVDNFSPRDGFIYYVTGSTQATLTISEFGAKEFYLLVASQAPQARLAIAKNAFFDGINGNLALNGANDANKLIKVVKFGNKYVCTADRQNERQTIALASVNGGNLSFTNFQPVVGALYFTDGSTTYSNTSNFESIDVNYPDGAYFYVQRANDTANNGNIFFRQGATIKVGGSGLLINRNDLMIHKVIKIGGAWYVQA